ncbi:MAG TPA: hypothetical protein V6C76_07060 [Drouetiella sp.]
MRAWFILLSTLLVISGGSLRAFAEEYTDEELGIEPGSRKGVTSIEAWTNLPKGNANSMGLAAEYSTRMGYLDQAIKQSKKALERDPEDLDLHQGYAEALENKIKTQDERDPYLYNECVKEWLMVLRNEVGDESGMTWHGLSIPAMQTLYRDSARGAVAKRHLEDLTGSLPKSWETNARYLKRIQRDADSKVAGKIIAKPKAPEKDTH